MRPTLTALSPLVRPERGERGPQGIQIQLRDLCPFGCGAGVHLLLGEPSGWPARIRSLRCVACYRGWMTAYSLVIVLLHWTSVEASETRLGSVSSDDCLRSGIWSWSPYLPPALPRGSHHFKITLKPVIISLVANITHDISPSGEITLQAAFQGPAHSPDLELA